MLIFAELKQPILKLAMPIIITPLIEKLQARVTEIEWYAKQHNLRAEPEIYPKGLFRAQENRLARYQLSRYTEELRNDIQGIIESSSELVQQKRSESILQKIQVIINSLQSQNLRKRPIGPAETLLGQVDLEQGNAYAHFKAQNTVDGHGINKNLKKFQQDIKVLRESYQLKQKQLNHIHLPAAEKEKLQEEILGIGQQIGLLEHKITVLNESKKSTKR